MMVVLSQTCDYISIAMHSNCAVPTAGTHTVCTIHQMCLIAIAPEVGEVSIHTSPKP